MPFYSLMLGLLSIVFALLVTCIFDWIFSAQESKRVKWCAFATITATRLIVGAAWIQIIFRYVPDTGIQMKFVELFVIPLCMYILVSYLAYTKDDDSEFHRNGWYGKGSIAATGMVLCVSVNVAVSGL